MKTPDQTTDKATARPWRVWQDDSSLAIFIEIADGEDRLIAKLPSIAGKIQEANAALIVKAVNEAEALEAVAVAAKIVASSGPLRNGMRDDAALDMLDEALANLRKP